MYPFNPTYLSSSTFIEESQISKHIFYTLSHHPNPNHINDNTEFVTINNKNYYLYTKLKK